MKGAFAPFLLRYSFVIFMVVLIELFSNFFLEDLYYLFMLKNEYLVR